jgi:Kef-type K+ transport system membrane component KefB
LLLLAGSIVAGGALGFAALQYLRVLHERYFEWALVIAAFIVAQAVRLIQLDPVLMALAAGVTLRNVGSGEAERLRSELKRCAVPVYVVFFSLAGAGLGLDALSEMWPWALLLMGLRITGLRWAGGLRWTGGEFARYGWLGLVSQGGLAITLAGLLRRAFPQSNVSLEALLVAMVGVNQVAGPLCFQWALRRTGEVREREGNELHDVPETAVAVGSGNSGV